jgi:hypothetical protein
MRTYTLFVLDERYSVETVGFVEAADAAQATALAKLRLEESPRHISIEVCEDDVPVARISPTGVVCLSEGRAP